MAKAVAITGIGIICALGRGREAVWRAIVRGQSAVGRRAGAPWLCAPLPRENGAHDPFVIAALRATREALADRGADELPPAERIGCAISSSKGGAHTLERAARAGQGSALPKDWLARVAPSAAAGAVARELSLRGPVACVGTGCAAGVHSVILGVRWILDGRCDMVFAGASDVSATELVLAGFGRMGVLSADAVRPFDRRRSGFALGEGAAVLVLERAKDVAARGGAAYALVAGFSDRPDTHGALRFDPSGKPLARRVSEALAGLARWAKRPGYINAHGTATPANDAAEAAALRAALGERWREVPVSSTKAATGHLLAAAGALEVAICALALRDGLAPPTLGLEEPDPACALRHVPGEALPWPADWALSISMALGGHIGVLALERWPR